MKTKKGYTLIAWAFSFLSVVQQLLAPVANQQDQIKLLVRKPQVDQFIDEPETKGKKSGLFSGVNREGGEFKSFHVIANSATSSVAGITPQNMGVVITPSVDNFPLVTFLPSDNLWPPIGQQDKGNS